MIVSPEVIVEAAGPLGDAPSRPIKAFYNLCGYDPSEESPILLSWIGDFFLSGGLPKMATCSESKQFTVCNKLGFSLIYMQAKEWALDRVVGQPEIQSFVGAIAGKHGDGLFVTTACFSQKAKDYAALHHIILIDGEKLARLMIEYNFCVSVKKTFEVKEIDTDALNEYMDD